MAWRARMVRPELRTSETVAGWPIEARYLWVLLWGYVDDYGRGKDNARLIAADCFPLDDIGTDQVEGWLTLFADSGVIERYDVDGARYLQVRNWREHQKVGHPSKSPIPCPHGRQGRPDDASCDAHEPLMRVAGDPPETLTPKVGGSQGEVKSGEGAPSAQPPARSCPKHPDGTDTPCGPCKTARLEWERWDAAHQAPPPSTPRPPRKGECRHRERDGFCLICGDDLRQKGAA